MNTKEESILPPFLWSMAVMELLWDLSRDEFKSISHQLENKVDESTPKTLLRRKTTKKLCATAPLPFLRLGEFNRSCFLTVCCLVTVHAVFSLYTRCILAEYTLYTQRIHSVYSN